MQDLSMFELSNKRDRLNCRLDNVVHTIMFNTAYRDQVVF